MDGSKIDQTFKSIVSDQKTKNFEKIEEEQVTTDKDLKKKAEKMEGVFMSQVVKAMKKTIPKTNKSTTGNLSSFMFSRVMGKAMAKSDIGISKMIYNSIKQKGQENINLDEIEQGPSINTSQMLKNLQE